MHCRPQKRLASETHLMMCVFLIIFSRFSSSIRLFTFCSGFSTELSTSLHVFLPFLEAYVRMKGLLTKAPLSFLQRIVIIKAQCLQNTPSTEGL